MLNEILIILILSVVGIAVFRLLDIPAVLGYLVVGLLAGDRAFGLMPGSGPFHASSLIDGSMKGLNKTYSYGDEIIVELEPEEIRIVNFDTVVRD